MKKVEMNAALAMHAEATDETKIVHQKYPFHTVTWKEDLNYKIYVPNISEDELQFFENFLTISEGIPKGDVEWLANKLRREDIYDYEIESLRMVLEDKYDVVEPIVEWLMLRAEKFEFIGEGTLEDGVQASRRVYYGEVPPVTSSSMFTDDMPFGDDSPFNSPIECSTEEKSEYNKKGTEERWIRNKDWKRGAEEWLRSRL